MPLSGPLHRQGNNVSATPPYLVRASPHHASMHTRTSPNGVNLQQLLSGRACFWSYRLGQTAGKVLAVFYAYAVQCEAWGYAVVQWDEAVASLVRHSLVVQVGCNSPKVGCCEAHTKCRLPAVGSHCIAHPRVTQAAICPPSLLLRLHARTRGTVPGTALEQLYAEELLAT